MPMKVSAPDVTDSGELVANVSKGPSGSQNPWIDMDIMMDDDDDG